MIREKNVIGIKKTSSRLCFLCKGSLNPTQKKVTGNIGQSVAKALYIYCQSECGFQWCS